MTATARADDVRSAPTPAGETDTSDPFLQGFFARVPAEAARSFTRLQLDAIKIAFGTRQWDQHAVDIRRTFGAGRWRFYLVFLMGRSRRRRDGRGHRLLAYIADAIGGALERTRRGFAIMVLASVLGLGLLVAGGLIYAGKRAMNINIVPGVDMLPDKAIEGILH